MAPVTDLLAARGAAHALDAFVVAAAIDTSSRWLALGLGDGCVALLDLATPSAPPRRVEAHRGAVLSLVLDQDGQGFLSGGDDGRLVRTAPDGTTTELHRKQGGWVEPVLAFAGKGAWRAAGLGKDVLLWTQPGEPRVLPHPSTVTGLATDAKGKRLAVSHYGGATLHWTASKAAEGKLLAWKGSHIAVAMQPDAAHVATAMQENALHVWRLSDGGDLRMSGYATKTRSMSFTANGRWLATSGADSVVVWPFFGGGPSGKPPEEIAGGTGILCTQVACHPDMELVAAGYADGLVLLAEIASGRVLPLAEPKGSAVTALAWSDPGTWLAFGCEDGRVGVIDLAKR